MGFLALAGMAAELGVVMLLYRIAVPTLGSMIAAPLLSLFVVPAAHALMLRWRVEPEVSG